MSVQQPIKPPIYSSLLGTHLGIGLFHLVWVLLFGISSPASLLFAQGSVHVTNYSREDGLFSNRVFQVYQDKRGMYWMVHPNGIDYFDGVHFFHPIKWENPSGYLDVRIVGEDQEERLWVRKRGVGDTTIIYTIDIKTRRCQRWVPPKGQFQGDIEDVTCDKTGVCWFIDKQGMVWKGIDGKYQLLESDLFGFRFASSKQRSDRVYLLWKEPVYANKLAVASMDLGGNLRYLRKIDIPEKHQNIVEFQDGITVSCDENGIGYVNLQGDIAYLKLPSALANDLQGFPLQLDLQGYLKGTLRLWYLHGGQIKTVSFQKGKVTRWEAIPKQTFFDPAFLELHIDRQQQAWVCGLEGVSQLVFQKQLFKRFSWIDPQSGQNYLTYSSRGLEEGKDGSIFAVSGPNLLHKPAGTDQMAVIANANYLYGIGLDKSGQSIWVGSGHQLINYWPVNRTSTTWSNYIGAGPYWAIHDLGNELLLGCGQGLSIFDKGAGEFRGFSNYNSYDLLKSTSIYQITPRSSGGYWIVSDKGVFVFHSKDGIMAHYGFDRPAPYKLPVEAIYHLSIDRKGRYWMASPNGLLNWNPETGVSRVFDHAGGFPFMECYAVYPDDYGTLWVNTSDGIVQFHPDNSRFRVFREEDGVAHREGNRISHLQASDGTIYFGSLNGITAFHPKDFRDFTQPGRRTSLLLSDALTYDAKRQTFKSLIADYHRVGKLEISSQYSMLKLYLAFPENRNAARGSYSFRIPGYQDNWVPVSRPFIELMTLPYGQYVIELQATSSDGQVEGSLMLPMEVIRPFYRRGWFFALVLVGVLSSMGYYFRRRVQKLQVQRKVLEQLVEKRTEKIQEDKAIITQQADALRIQHQLKNRFFANVTHEFRTPITLINGPIQAVLHSDFLRSREKKQLEIASRSAHQLLELVDDILMLSSLEMQKVTVHRIHFSLNRLLFELLEQFKIPAEQNKLAFSLHCSLPAEQMVRTDPRLIRMICTNLLSNAFKYTKPGGHVDLYANIINGILEIRVADTGRGIHPSDLPFVFDRFFQTNQPDAPVEGGTGIGLAISQELAELLHGSLEVESTLGEGTQFTLSLPVESHTPTEASSEVEMLSFPHHTTTSVSPIPKVFRSNKPVRPLLIVEDNPDMREHLYFLLEDYFNLQMASNGKEALVLLEGGCNPLLIISDWMMPEMDGLQLLEKVRTLYSGKFFLPFLLLTARVLPEDKQSALLLGVDDYLVKPFSQESLLAVVHTLVSRFESRSESLKSENKEADTVELSVQGGVDHKQWLDELQAKALQLIGSDTFSVDQLAQAMQMGRTYFFRRVKQLTGLTPNQYILDIRLSKARFLLETQPNLTVRSVVREVGLRDEHYFVQAFKKRFGQLPSYYK